VLLVLTLFLLAVLGLLPHVPDIATALLSGDMHSAAKAAYANKYHIAIGVFYLAEVVAWVTSRAGKKPASTDHVRMCAVLHLTVAAMSLICVAAGLFHSAPGELKAELESSTYSVAIFVTSLWQATKHLSDAHQGRTFPVQQRRRSWARQAKAKVQRMAQWLRSLFRDTAKPKPPAKRPAGAPKLERGERARRAERRRSGE
jgi:hypothetical protein